MKKVEILSIIYMHFPNLLASLAKEHDLEQLVHLSALGLDNAKDSNYAISKLNGEKIVQEKFPKCTILRPSVVYSVDDNFTTNFMTLLSRLQFSNILQWRHKIYSNSLFRFN